ncbi:hypothetical protein EGY05_08520 [Chryseobacterium arthrosphaerae]|uniref:hypothetical protein n=1 Tax=Chryseobacterium arthrosphaerae TaxID=651561 RepID=UPI000F4D4636|nr:hypothetical protein [Chryseobacterium arthrosphaerae]AYZ11964.1 hypothetical protein EGY05_08520 [Chryseobacterium arthrosphaerae]
MKVIFKLFLTIFLFLVLSCQKQEGQIYYIDMGISPVRSINCDSLRLHPNKKQLTLSNDENNKLINIFSKLIPVKNNLDVDARLYGFVYDGSKKLDFCSGIGVIELNGKKYLVNDSLREYMIKLTLRKK